MSYWTAINTLFLLGSLAMYFAVTFTMYSNGMFLSLPSAFSFVGEMLIRVPHSISLCVFVYLSFKEKTSLRYLHKQSIWSVEKQQD